MNREETIALWQKGKGAWNTWARAMLAERKRLEESGEWEQKQGDWEERAGADFEGHAFENDADFCEYIFPGHVNFSEATFSDSVCFGGAIFCDGAGFVKVKFSGDVWFAWATFVGFSGFPDSTFSGTVDFSETTFYDDAVFSKATFSDDAGFINVTFYGDADFRSVTFSDTAYFIGGTFGKSLTLRSAVFEKPMLCKNARFCGDTTFWGMRADGGFDLQDARFVQVPDFRQASFREAIGLDEVKIRVPITLTGPDGKDITYTPPDLTGQDAARWRALRRMAAQAGDHVQEAEFFAQELQAHRGYADKPHTSARWWLGWGYQIGSDFGRSAPLPFLWLSNLVVWFSLLYAWLGEGFQVGRAALLSLKNALPFLFVGQDTGGLYDALYPHGVPLGVTALGAFETFCGGVLVFLLILGARYTLRVR
jgi:uncharacterized protein YjbI with pentapeptide repeats